LFTNEGYETAALRKHYGLSKNKNKMSETFDAHCVDAWVLAMDDMPTRPPMDEEIIVMKQLMFHRRQLHAFQPSKGGERRNYGSTRSLGFRRGSIVRHPKWGVCTVGGTSKGRISLHSLQNNSRIFQNAKPSDCESLAYNAYCVKHIPVAIPPTR
jgi:hypothetical protein